MAYAVIRHYKGSAELIDELGRRAGEVENVIRGVSGFQDYYLVRSDDGGFSFFSSTVRSVLSSSSPTGVSSEMTD